MEKLFARFINLKNMSRIGKQPIIIPEGVAVEISGREVKVTGPLGGLKLNLPADVVLEKKTHEVLVLRKGNSKETRSNHGTIRTLVNNMVLGVTKGWEKNLEVVGTGYRVDLSEGKLVFKVGLSHSVEVEPAEGITFTAADNKIKVTGADKELVGNIAAALRRIRPPDAYQGKGVRYADEVIKLKPGKAAKVGGGSAGG